MNWNWQIIIDSIPKLLQGSIITIELVVLSGLLGFMLAVPLALARLSKKPWVQALPFAYIFFFRGTPLLVQIFLIYYGLSQFKWVTESVLWCVSEPILVRYHRFYPQYRSLYRRNHPRCYQVNTQGRE